MNNIRNSSVTIMIMVLSAALLAACSTINQDSPLSFVDPSGNHPDGWVTAHGSYAAPDGSFCVDCHGADLLGGITGISCSSDAEGCHGNGPAFHPADWLDSSLSGNDWHGDAARNFFQINGFECLDCHDTTTTWPDEGECAVCHFTPGGAKSPGGWAHADTGTAHAAFAGSAEQAVCTACHDVNISFGNQDSCHNCHEVAIHDVEYLDHDQDVPSSGDFTTLCSSCHAVTGTSPNTGAPECVTCHTEGSPYVQTNCRSCHGNPPSDSAGGEHGEHSGASCDECHLNAGSGTGLNHFYDGEVDVQFLQSVTYSGGECNGTCHIGSESEDHNNRDW